ncbi:MAG: hypothetical protein R2932_16310 [Caldilineaceae bacterium]
MPSPNMGQARRCGAQYHWQPFAVYAPLMAIHCTAWTFMAAWGGRHERGWAFCRIHLGLTLMAALRWFVLRKIIRISAPTAASLLTADFIACAMARADYLGTGHSHCNVGVVPYIALQLKP